MFFLDAAPPDLSFPGNFHRARGTKARGVAWLLGWLLALFLTMGGGAHGANAAPATKNQTRVLAATAARPPRATAATRPDVATRAQRETTWRAWLLAQAAALACGLLLVARAETNERRGASVRFATRGAVALKVGAQLALLTAFSLPIAALWLDERRSEYSQSGAAQGALVLALALAILATLFGRLRARHAGTFALLFCSAAGVFTSTFFLLADAVARYAWTAQRAPRWLLRSGGWLENAARETAAPHWNDAFFASHFDAQNGGFSVAAIWVLGVASVLAAPHVRRKVFGNPPLEVRHTHPLSTAWTGETRAQIRLLEWCGFGALLLALRPLGDAPLLAIFLTTAAAFSLWGWRHRALDARRFCGALCGALVAATLLLLLWLASARLDARFRAPREYSQRSGAPQRAAARNLAMLKNVKSVRAENRTATANRAATAKRTNAAPSRSSNTRPVAASAKSAVTAAPARPTLNAFLGDAARRGALLVWLVLLMALAPLLRRPPPILWRLLGNAPAWGWMLLGGLLASPLLLPAHGAIGFTMLIGTLFSAFVFVWLEGA